MMNGYSGLELSPRKVSYLKYLFEHGGCAKISEIAGHFGVDPSTVTRTVQELKGEEYLLHDPYGDVILTGYGREYGACYEHHLHDYLFANKTDAPLVDTADIIGRSCYGDRLMPIVRIPEVAVGDVLALLDTGAYQEVSMSNFNAMPRPATVLVTGDRAALVRRRETEEDVLRRDVMPEHLAG